jgi:hypothetical protein
LLLSVQVASLKKSISQTNERIVAVIKELLMSTFKDTTKITELPEGSW